MMTSNVVYTDNTSQFNLRDEMLRYEHEMLRQQKEAVMRKMMNSIAVPEPKLLAPQEKQPNPVLLLLNP